MGLIIRSSGIHAAGCYTTSAIRKGARVVEYTGARLSKQEADIRYQGSPVTYLFGLGDGSVVIDGHGLAMFINHSCDPNCETTEVGGRVWIGAIRDIAPGEEITYDYCLYDGGDEEAPCNCGAGACRGTMYAPNGNGHKPAPLKAERRRRKPVANGRAVNGGRGANRRPALQRARMRGQRSRRETSRAAEETDSRGLLGNRSKATADFSLRSE